MIDRRTFVAGITAALAPRVVEAQQAGKVHQVGVLSPGGPSPFWPVFAQALHERGWIGGRNIAFEYRFAEGRTDQLSALAAELVKRDVDIIVAGLGATAAAMNATKLIPIVMTFGAAEVEAGLIGSLARPQGNVTGLTGDVATDIIGKRLELLREIAPRIRRVVALSGRRWSPAWPGTEPGGDS